MWRGGRETIPGIGQAMVEVSRVQVADSRNQHDATDRQIDRLVYALYGLSDEEIRIVEGGG